MKVKGTYTEIDSAYELTIEYEYYWRDETYDSKFEDDLTIENVYLNNESIICFYSDYLSDKFYNRVLEYAIENKYE